MRRNRDETWSIVPQLFICFLCVLLKQSVLYFVSWLTPSENLNYTQSHVHCHSKCNPYQNVQIQWNCNVNTPLINIFNFLFLSHLFRKHVFNRLHHISDLFTSWIHFTIHTPDLGWIKIISLGESTITILVMKRSPYYFETIITWFNNKFI